MASDVGTSACPARTAVSMAQYMVGTPANDVTFSRFMSSRAATGSNRGIRTMVACRRNPVFMTTVWPNEWNSGSVAR